MHIIDLVEICRITLGADYLKHPILPILPILSSPLSSLFLPTYPSKYPYFSKQNRLNSSLIEQVGCREIVWNTNWLSKTI